MVGIQEQGQGTDGITRVFPAAGLKFLVEPVAKTHGHSMVRGRLESGNGYRSRSGADRRPISPRTAYTWVECLPKGCCRARSTF